MSPKVVLRTVDPKRAAELLELQLRNREYWRASGPRRDDEWFTVARQRTELEAQAVDEAEGLSLNFGVHVGSELVGRISLALRHLLLDGAWRDQELWAITVEDMLQVPSSV